MPDPRYTLGPAAAAQIAEIVRRVNGQIYNQDARQKKRPVIYGAGVSVVDAIVTSAITAASGTTYGSGAAQIYIDNDSGVAIEDPSYPSPVTVLNWYQNSGTIAIGTHVKLNFRNGKWEFLGGDC